MLDTYDVVYPRLLEVSQVLSSRLKVLLSEHQVQVQAIDARVKDRDSLRRKLARPDRTYHHLYDVTDLIGLRVITYFEDDVDRAARLIEANLSVDFQHSTDKRRYLDAVRFGYRSLHYVCAYGGPGLDPAFRFEVQVRTALQHAWAEIEHDLGYKADSVPPALRRRFARVASLLEIADQEFVALRQELGDYRVKVSGALEGATQGVTVDGLSLDGLTRAPSLMALDDLVATFLARPRSETLFFPNYLVGVLERAGLRSADQLFQAAVRRREELATFVPRYFEFSARALGFPAERVEEVQRGYALLFLGLLTILRSDGLTLGKVATLTALYAELDRHPEREAHALASALVAATGG